MAATNRNSNRQRNKQRRTVLRRTVGAAERTRKRLVAAQRANGRLAKRWTREAVSTRGTFAAGRVRKGPPAAATSVNSSNGNGSSCNDSRSVRRRALAVRRCVVSAVFGVWWCLAHVILRRTKYRELPILRRDHAWTYVWSSSDVARALHRSIHELLVARRDHVWT